MSFKKLEKHIHHVQIIAVNMAFYHDNYQILDKFKLQRDKSYLNNQMLTCTKAAYFYTFIIKLFSLWDSEHNKRHQVCFKKVIKLLNSGALRNKYKKEIKELTERFDHILDSDQFYRIKCVRDELIVHYEAKSTVDTYDVDLIFMYKNTLHITTILCAMIDVEHRNLLEPTGIPLSSFWDRAFGG